MSGTLPETLEEIVQSIGDDFGVLEDRLASRIEHLSSVLAELEAERGRVQAALEELSLERSLAAPGEGPVDGDWLMEELRRREDELTSEYTNISSIHRQLNGFLHLLTASKQQFQTEEELPGIDDAQRLAIRQAMIRAQEDERRRLAREIHDGPAQVLANAIIGMEFVGRALRPAGNATEQPAVEEIERVKSAMREGLTEIRRFIFDLRPSMLSQRGLAATTEHYIQTYRHLFPGDVELQIPRNLPRLSPDQEMTAFRVIQESLQNVHRHARSSKTWVTISTTQNGIVVEIRDNGEGFRPASTSSTSTGGYGIAGMRERAEVIGAKLAVKSAPGEGTTVKLTIPLNSRALNPVRKTVARESPRMTERSNM